MINEAEHVLEGVVLLLEIHESRSGKTPSTELIGRENDEGGEALGIFVWIRIKENAVDDAENGCSRADAEGEGEDCGRGESWRFSKLTEREAAIRENRLEQMLNVFLENHARILAPIAE